MDNSLIELDELSVLIVVDNETDTLSSIDNDAQQSEIAGLLPRLPAQREHDGHPCTVVFDHLCCACHGFSALLRGRRGSEEHTVLFDAGPYPDVWFRNAERLGVDLASIEAVFLSHWHFDHSGALPEVIAAVVKARGEVLVDLHADRPDQRGILLPSGKMIMFPEEPSFKSLAPPGARLIASRDAHVFAGGFFYGSGAIDRQTDYETGLAGHHTFRGREARADPLILDERFLAARVRGRGTAVLSACSHAGVINVGLAAGRDVGAPIDAVIGGYHLSGKAMEARIPMTVRDLEERVRPRIVAPGHCSGWRAKVALANAFAGGRYAPSVVGTRYTLRAGS